ncbi:alpha/beta fold hydrolase [Georgenia sp. TF02-10]|uniref:alpha/beta fold hydrolase n=1 Tax=Georgenia sp. TF02-10 TaxID=2917725 RepID=UPI001FA7EA27|nr:alpha/beta fold hydrolase [Georgenia sp. TF02-10]UNX53693.1 alpha/beta fold hydrolase [Georgenia sp. TF02-10]
MSETTARIVVFLHGLGVGPDSWGAQLQALPPGMEGIAPPISGLHDADDVPFSLVQAARSLGDELDRRGIAAAHLCGLSLGAMVATRFALDYPERTASLTLSAGQAHPNRLLMGIQNVIMRILPERFVAPPGMSRQTLLDVLGVLGATDFRPELPRIAVPTLVLCGSKDRPNLPAARQLASAIPGAELQVVPGAGHEWNTQLPQEFSARLNEFLSRQVA